jgi:putative nucleotidyltransferase with HDIG domain
VPPNPPRQESSHSLILRRPSTDILGDSYLMRKRSLHSGPTTFLAGILAARVGASSSLASPLSPSEQPILALGLAGAAALAFIGSLARIHRSEVSQSEPVSEPAAIDDLARALDSRDVQTHRHTRRVQYYARTLARAMGCNDPAFLERLHTAALLHDVGKLAMPDHILNKPGRLSAGEMETMKLHAGLGADLLAAVGIDDAVVSFVRHHHENWNGLGYPARLAQSDIPLGARILAVADCFDALTSDRPYRRRLSDAQALQIIAERCGTMYEPRVVDAFVRAYRALPSTRGRRILPRWHFASLH